MNTQTILLIIQILSIIASITGLSISAYVALSKKKELEILNKIEFTKMNIAFLEKQQRVEKIIKQNTWNNKE
jgi:hypothetical protein